MEHASATVCQCCAELGIRIEMYVPYLQLASCTLVLFVVECGFSLMKLDYSVS